MTTCPKCNKELSEGTIFCQNCGASVAETPVEEKTVETPRKKKKLPKKAIMFGGIGIAVIAVLVLVISLFSGGGRKAKNNYALYLKDGEIFFTDLKKDSKAWQITSRLVDTDEVDKEDLANSGYYLGFYTYISKDGKYIFFPDKLGDDDGFNLYYRGLGNPESEAVKIDSGIESYTVNSSATIVTYIKGEEGNLYQYNLKEDSKEKIASEVDDFEVSDDGTKIIYINFEDSIYLKKTDEDKEKIASEVSSLEYLSADFTTIYYIKDGSLYKQSEGKDREKIDSDVSDVLKIYGTGEIYYLTTESEDASLMDFVTDDMKNADASIFEPEYPTYPDYPEYPTYPEEPDYPTYPDYPEYPSLWDYDTDAEYDAAVDRYNAEYAAWEEECDRLYAEYEAAYEDWESECERLYAEYEAALEAREAECDRLYAEYEAAYEAYWAKVSRDDLREALEEGSLDYASHSLCYYNGTEKTVISDAYVADDYYSDYAVADNTPVISYEAYNQSSFNTIKLSEIESIYDVKNMIEAAMFSSSERYVAVKGAATVVEQEKEAGYFEINDSGTVVYYIDDIPDEKNYGELYRISITDGVVGKPEVYDSDVYTGYYRFISDSQFEYFKEYKNGKGELYINKGKIDYDVRAYSVENYTDINKIFYFVDWNSEKQYGTLKAYQDGKAVKIADDVHEYFITPDGRALYLYDYSINYYKGELREWNNGETRKIDDDVVGLIPIFEK